MGAHEAEQVCAKRTTRNVALDAIQGGISRAAAHSRALDPLLRITIRIRIRIAPIELDRVERLLRASSRPSVQKKRKSGLSARTPQGTVAGEISPLLLRARMDASQNGPFPARASCQACAGFAVHPERVPSPFLAQRISMTFSHSILSVSKQPPSLRG